MYYEAELEQNRGSWSCKVFWVTTARCLVGESSGSLTRGGALSSARVIADQHRENMERSQRPNAGDRSAMKVYLAMEHDWEDDTVLAAYDTESEAAQHVAAAKRATIGGCFAVEVHVVRSLFDPALLGET